MEVDCGLCAEYICRYYTRPQLIDKCCNVAHFKIHDNLLRLALTQVLNCSRSTGVGKKKNICSLNHSALLKESESYFYVALRFRS